MGERLGAEQESQLTRQEVVDRLKKRKNELFDSMRPLGPKTAEEENADREPTMEASNAMYLENLLSGEGLWEGEPADLLEVLERKLALREDIKAGRKEDKRFANSTPVQKEIEDLQRQIRILKEAAGL